MGFISPWAGPNFLTTFKDKLCVVSFQRNCIKVFKKIYDDHPHCVALRPIFIIKISKITTGLTWKHGNEAKNIFSKTQIDFEVRNSKQEKTDRR